MNALAAIGLLTKRNGVFWNTPLVARYLSEQSPNNERLALMHIVHLWDRWSRLTQCVRTGSPPPSRALNRSDSSRVRAFIAAMHRNAAERSRYVVAAVPAKRARRMLDVGGGSGAYSIAFANAHPKLQVDLLDRPEVLPIAQAHIEEAGLADRIQTRAGDLRQDTLGTNYDLILLSAICHMLSPQENQNLLQRAFHALACKGRIVIQDFLLRADKTAPRSGAVFAVNMLVNTPGGNTYSDKEYASWLRAAGFSRISKIRLPGETGLMIGVRS